MTRALALARLCVILPAALAAWGVMLLVVVPLLLIVAVLAKPSEAKE